MVWREDVDGKHAPHGGLDTVVARVGVRLYSESLLLELTLDEWDMIGRRFWCTTPIG